MNELTINILCKQFDIDKDVIDFVNEKEKYILDKFEEIDKIKEYNQFKVINAMQECNYLHRF